MITFTTTTTSGHGRGKTLGFPTINMIIPDVLLEFKKGIYAARATINAKQHECALYYGPPITFGDIDDQLEIYILAGEINPIPKGSTVTMHVVSYIRVVKKFDDKESLIAQMNRDVSEVQAVLATDSKPADKH